MNVKQLRQADMLESVSRFGFTYADAFRPPSAGGQLFAALREALNELLHQETAQDSGRSQAREGTLEKKAARESLRTAVVAISRTARALAVERPGFKRKFQLPVGEADHVLLAAARAFAGDARRLASHFVAYGLRDGFVDDLLSSAARFEHAIASRAEGRRGHIVARAALNAALARAFSIVQRLDAVVVNVLAQNTVAMKAWRRARRVARRRRTPRARRPARRAVAQLIVIQPTDAEGTRTSG